jgi:hypothetical protein
LKFRGARSVQLLDVSRLLDRIEADAGRAAASVSAFNPVAIAVSAGTPRRAIDAMARNSVSCALPPPPGPK